MRAVRIFLVSIVALACSEPSNATVEKCTAQCDAAGDCPGGTGDCLDVCEAQYDEASRIECIPEYEGLLDCLGGEGDVCDPSRCTDEVTAYSICLGAFCAKDRGFSIGKDTVDPSCPQPEGSGGGG